MLNSKQFLRLSSSIKANGFRGFSLSATRNADLEVKLENGIKNVTMNRPAKKNALSTQMYEEMTSSLYESNEDKATKLIVFRGTGDFFTAGNDIAGLFEAYKNKTTIENMGFAKFTRGLIDCRKPIVALVNGHAVGIGVTMLPHCETVFASDKATFNTPFIKLGIPPECCSSYLFPKTMGFAKAGEMLHFNATLTAAEAYTGNLVTRVYSHSEFEKKAWEQIHKMVEFPLESLVHSKELLRGRERELLHKVHKEESQNVNMDIVAKALMKFMSKPK